MDAARGNAAAMPWFVGKLHEKRDLEVGQGEAYDFVCAEVHGSTRRDRPDVAVQHLTCVQSTACFKAVLLRHLSILTANRS